MFNKKTVLAIITARGGSKSVFKKNIKEVNGKPLIAWTIEEAKKSKYIDRLVLSSEDNEIISVAKSWGCEAPFVRPKELALDETPGIEPVLHAIKTISGYDYVVLLQPTSPLRSVVDIDACIEKCIQEIACCYVSVSETETSPFWMYCLNQAGNIEPIINREHIHRRQDLPQVYIVNGAVYVANCAWLIQRRDFISEETKAYIMPKDRSLDIDTELDFMLLEHLLRTNQQNI